MQVDRSRFVALTAAIAAGACSAPRPTAEEPVASVVELDQTGEALSANVATQSVASADPAPVASHLSSDAGGLPTDVPFFERFDRLVRQLEQSQGKCVRPQVPQAPWTVRMEEQPKPIVGPARQCETLREPPGPHCEDFVLVYSDCAETVSTLAPAVARRAMTCLQNKSGTRALCGARRVVAQCAQQAIAPVAIKPETAEVCRQVVSQCADGHGLPGPRPTVTTCQRYLSSLRCWHLGEGSHCLVGACSVGECLQMTY